MKALDLQIFEKHPDVDAYRFGPSFTPHAIVAEDKHLTEAELSAMYWGCAFEVLDSRNMGSHEYSQKRLRESVFLHRFATLPHYDEQ